MNQGGEKSKKRKWGVKRRGGRIIYGGFAEKIEFWTGQVKQTRQVYGGRRGRRRVRGG